MYMSFHQSVHKQKRLFDSRAQLAPLRFNFGGTERSHSVLTETEYTSEYFSVKEGDLQIGTSFVPPAAATEFFLRLAALFVESTPLAGPCWTRSFSRFRGRLTLQEHVG
jgi:hypothetical protein